MGRYVQIQGLDMSRLIAQSAWSRACYGMLVDDSLQSVYRASKGMHAFCLPLLVGVWQAISDLQLAW